MARMLKSAAWMLSCPMKPLRLHRKPGERLPRVATLRDPLMELLSVLTNSTGVVAVCQLTCYCDCQVHSLVPLYFLSGLSVAIPTLFQLGGWAERENSPANARLKTSACLNDRCCPLYST